jgi:phage gp36-like protein
VPAYCTPEDLLNRYGLDEMFQLAPGPYGQPDPVKVQRACDDAGDMVDGYIRPRHTLPLTAVPRILVRLSAAIARYDLHLGGDRQPSDQVTRERDQAIAFLKDVAAGKADLGLDSSGAEPAEDGGGVVVAAGEPRNVTLDDLSAYRSGWRG